VVLRRGVVLGGDARGHYPSVGRRPDGEREVGGPVKVVDGERAAGADPVEDQEVGDKVVEVVENPDRLGDPL
jgi:hypothetical protein